MYFCLPYIINPNTFNSWQKWFIRLPEILRESVTKTPFWSVSILVIGWKPFLKPLYKFLIFFILQLVSRSSILAFRYSFFLCLKCLQASCQKLYGLSTFFWFGLCNHCTLACFLWSKNRKLSSANNGLCSFNSHRPKFYSSEVLIFSLIFSQALLMSSLLFKFFKAANLFEILI